MFNMTVNWLIWYIGHPDCHKGPWSVLRYWLISQIPSKFTNLQQLAGAIYQCLHYITHSILAKYIAKKNLMDNNLYNKADQSTSFCYLDLYKHKIKPLYNRQWKKKSFSAPLFINVFHSPQYKNCLSNLCFHLFNPFINRIKKIQ